MGNVIFDFDNFRFCSLFIDWSVDNMNKDMTVYRQKTQIYQASNFYYISDFISLY
jgi:hypothetical protein